MQTDIRCGTMHAVIFSDCDFKCRVLSHFHGTAEAKDDDRIGEHV